MSGGNKTLFAINSNVRAAREWFRASSPSYLELRCRSGAGFSFDARFDASYLASTYFTNFHTSVPYISFDVIEGAEVAFGFLKSCEGDIGGHVQSLRGSGPDTIRVWSVGFPPRSDEDLHV
jgi:hypothetical protein